MFKKKEKDFKDFKGPWDNKVEKLLEQSVPLAAASIINQEGVDFEDEPKKEMISIIMKLVLDTANLIWEEAKKNYTQKSQDDGSTEYGYNTLFGSGYTKFPKMNNGWHTETVKHTIPVDEFEKIIENYLEKEGYAQIKRNFDKAAKMGPIKMDDVEQETLAHRPKKPKGK